MLYIIGLFLGFISVFFKKSKILLGMWGTYFVVLFGYNTLNPDLLAYTNVYRLFSLNIYDGKLSDAGFIYLIKSALSFNLSFPQFQLLYAIVCISILFFLIYKLSYTPNIVALFFLVYPLTLSIVQLRFFLASLIVALGVYVLSLGKKYSDIVFGGSVILAYLIHYSSILYLCLYLIKTKSLKRMYAYLAFILGFIIFLVATGSFFNIDILIRASQKYFTSSLEYKGLVFFSRVIFFRMVPVLLLHFLYERFRHCFAPMEVNSMKIVNITMIVSMLFELIDSEFERFARIGFIFLYIIIFNICSRMKLQSNKIVFISLFTVFILLVFIFQNFYRNSNEVPFIDSVFRTIFENNEFIKE